jgi:hypothetical protein
MDGGGVSGAYGLRPGCRSLHLKLRTRPLHSDTTKLSSIAIVPSSGYASIILLLVEIEFQIHSVRPWFWECARICMQESRKFMRHVSVAACLIHGHVFALIGNQPWYDPTTTNSKGLRCFDAKIARGIYSTVTRLSSQKQLSEEMARD